MGRGQVRVMVTGESVITAVIGALLGVVLGFAFAAILSRPLADEGFVFEVPFLIADPGGSPRRDRGRGGGDPALQRASRVDVLRAVTTE